MCKLQLYILSPQEEIIQDHSISKFYIIMNIFLDRKNYLIFHIYQTNIKANLPKHKCEEMKISLLMSVFRFLANV